ncbi:MAG: acetate--CoA ligase family protein [Rhodoplanes sp.]|uniref:acetate--CoA ligase family protein n=1 Tax=Rhodoplanes sp. TaxID=1968906 RepID=UPI0017D526F9|nr:acetate--CoA ligase family protein [Rhodoplanes sp.]NVO15289.1 acetate--CoA ligase family protein [Rhodoplanes sp.]
MSAVGRLFHPRSIAVVGASSDPGKLIGRPIAYLEKHGFAGAIYPVNPRYDRVGSRVCYPDVASLPEVPDVGLVLLGADRAVSAVEQLARAGAVGAVVLASGFGESGEEGRRRQCALKEAAGAMRLLGPNTIGLANVTDKIMLSASGAMELDGFVSGSVALVSQSGGILGSLLSRGAARGIGFSKLVATGNEADLDISDFVDHLVDDDATSVIALYIEGVRNSDRFRASAAKAAQRGKRLVAYKVGRSETGARSAVSHTGALAGSDRVYDALFRQLGIIRAQTFSDLLDIPAALATGRLLAGNRLAVVTTTGGAATLIADNAGLADFSLPAPDETTAQGLMALDIPDAALDRNPVDVTLAGLRPELFRTVLSLLSDSPTYDAIVTIVGSSALGQPDLVARPVIEALARTTKPIVAYVSPEAPHIVNALNRAGVPAFASPEGCVTALSALRAASERPARMPAIEPRSGAASAAGKHLGDGPLNEAESKALFARFGIRPVTELVTATPDEAQAAAHRLGDGPVVLKILSRHIAHKTEVGGVVVGVVPDEVGARCRDMAARLGGESGGDIEGFLVQERVSGGVEVILGVHRDPQLGPAILLGMGGVAAELLEDTALRPLPLMPGDAEAMIAELKMAPLLHGYRGRPRADVAALRAAIEAFAEMVWSLGERLREAEINPLFVLPEGQGVKAADGLVVLATAT